MLLILLKNKCFKIDGKSDSNSDGAFSAKKFPIYYLGDAYGQGPKKLRMNCLI